MDSCILIDMLDDTLYELKALSRSYAQKYRGKYNAKDSDKNNLYMFDSVVSLFKNEINNENVDKESVKKESYDKILLLSKTFVKDLSESIQKVPTYVIYILNKLKSRLIKVIVGKNKDSKSAVKKEVNHVLIRLFYKHVINKVINEMMIKNAEIININVNIKLVTDDDKYTKLIFK